jgi:hypothetical protein
LENILPETGIPPCLSLYGWAVALIPKKMSNMKTNERMNNWMCKDAKGSLGLIKKK